MILHVSRSISCMSGVWQWVREHFTLCAPSPQSHRSQWDGVEMRLGPRVGSLESEQVGSPFEPRPPWGPHRPSQGMGHRVQESFSFLLGEGCGVFCCRRNSGNLIYQMNKLSLKESGGLVQNPWGGAKAQARGLPVRQERHLVCMRGTRPDTCQSLALDLPLLLHRFWDAQPMVPSAFVRPGS